LRNKTGDEKSNDNISGDVIGEVKSVKYLRSFAQKDGSFVMGVKHRIRCGWIKLREVSGILCDERILTRLNCKFHSGMVRLTMLNGSECWTVDSRIEQSMRVLVMRMLKRMTREGRIREQICTR